MPEVPGYNPWANAYPNGLAGQKEAESEIKKGRESSSAEDEAVTFVPCLDKPLLERIEAAERLLASPQTL
jgi:hypothetical protein